MRLISLLINLKYFLKIAATLFLLLVSLGLGMAQDTLKINEKFYRLTLGGGFGSGYPLQEDDFGIGGNLDFTIQKNNSIYTLGIRVVTEFVLFESSNVDNSINSVDLTYGKVFKGGCFFSSISAGIACVKSEHKGKLLSREGGWLFATYTYEKIKHYTIGFPLSVKIFWVPLRFYGLGTELYANLNTVNPFYGINFCHQFGKLRRPKIKKNNSTLK